jgi:hypothetical protein
MLVQSTVYYPLFGLQCRDLVFELLIKLTHPNIKPYRPGVWAHHGEQVVLHHRTAQVVHGYLVNTYFRGLLTILLQPGRPMTTATCLTRLPSDSPVTASPDPFLARPTYPTFAMAARGRMGRYRVPFGFPIHARVDLRPIVLGPSCGNGDPNSTITHD